MTIAVLARDLRGHFLAVSPLESNGGGFGIIDLNTAEARIVHPPARGSELAN